ncbi:MAG: FAD-dependent oxidoreductase [Bacteroidetes bacterium HGW-Bacteroidetes-1]|jgi:glycerol-3-phosphate dehydrogenase|nr:MAG: FAD-dependent oxidoreductase [Bacteroidetes bacterium HGW-Bacteroidetes-1]
MKRDEMIEKMIRMKDSYDIIVIGGGATGIGIALESSTRGYKTILLEQSDFTKSTSSKSTKLVHGGVRYMAQGDLALVREACVERGRLVRNAPHLVQNQSFIIPAFGWFDALMYTVGLTFYDLLAGSLSLGRSQYISKKITLSRIATLNEKKITGGVLYHDGMFDDSRLAINLLQTAAAHNAHLINYMQVKQLTKDDKGMIRGVVVEDLETNTSYTLNAKVVINATGVFADTIMQMDRPEMKKIIRPSQGVHIVLDKEFLPGEDALMIPKTEDGRVLFAVPWHNKVIVGTTDTPLSETSLEPVALTEEIDFILKTSSRYLKKAPKKGDVLSVFAGLRPLAATKGENKKTKEISRSHKIIVSESELFTMIGGKWTTFRKMAEDMLRKVEKKKFWKRTASKTRNMHIHGYVNAFDRKDPFCIYGTDKSRLLRIQNEEIDYQGFINESLQLYKAQVVYAVREEMAQTVEDVLLRRTRCLLLNARETMKVAAEVAEIMAIELQKDQQWVDGQLAAFNDVASNYVIH